MLIWNAHLECSSGMFNLNAHLECSHGIFMTPPLTTSIQTNAFDFTVSKLFLTILWRFGNWRTDKFSEDNITKTDVTCKGWYHQLTFKFWSKSKQSWLRCTMSIFTLTNVTGIVVFCKDGSHKPLTWNHHHITFFWDWERNF